MKKRDYEKEFLESIVRDYVTPNKIIDLTPKTSKGKRIRGWIRFYWYIITCPILAITSYYYAYNTQYTTSLTILGSVFVLLHIYGWVLATTGDKIHAWIIKKLIMKMK